MSQFALSDGLPSATRAPVSAKAIEPSSVGEPFASLLQAASPTPVKDQDLARSTSDSTDESASKVNENGDSKAEPTADAEPADHHAADREPSRSEDEREPSRSEDEREPSRSEDEREPKRSEDDQDSTRDDLLAPFALAETTKPLQTLQDLAGIKAKELTSAPSNQVAAAKSGLAQESPASREAARALEPTPSPPAKTPLAERQAPEPTETKPFDSAAKSGTSATKDGSASGLPGDDVGKADAKPVVTKTLLPVAESTVDLATKASASAAKHQGAVGSLAQDPSTRPDRRVATPERKKPDLGLVTPASNSAKATPPTGLTAVADPKPVSAGEGSSLERKDAASAAGERNSEPFIETARRANSDAVPRFDRIENPQQEPAINAAAPSAFANTGSGPFPLAVSAGAPAALAPLANSAAPSPANLRPTLTLPDLQAVVDRIALQAKPGIQRISFQVEPPELGRLTIQLTMRGGRLHGVINADSGEVASMLRDGIEVVRQSMGRSGLDVASFEIKSETQNNPEHRDSASPFESQNDHSPKPRSHRQESRASGNAAADGAANDKKQPTKLTVENSLTSDSSTPSLDMVI